MATDKLVNLPPDQILADDNIRYSILSSDVSDLKESILSQGGVLVPIEVEPLAKDAQVNGYKYRLTVGFKRHRAVLELNKESQAGLELPAIVRSLSDDKVRLQHQVSENVDRKSLSPMDVAVTIQKLLDAGYSKLDVRQMFRVTRPGGKKELVTQAASNSWLNIMLSFLALPKPIQQDIHEGRIGTAAAMVIVKAPAEKQQEIADKAKAAVAEAIEAEEKEEEKFLAKSKKLDEAQAAVSTATSELETAKAEAELADKALNEQEVARNEAFTTLKAAERAKDKAAIKAAKEAFDAAEANVKGAVKRIETASKAVTKAEDAAKKNAERVQELADKLAEARKPKGGVVGTADVKKAAKASGVETGHTPMSIGQVRKAVDDLSTNTVYPNAARIGVALKKCFAGVTTPGILLKELATVTGELQAAPKKAAATKK